MAAESLPVGAPGDRGRRRRVRMSGDERERAILAAAAELLRDRPVHEVSVDDLARAAGISRPTFYFYFASKEAVLLALLDRMVERARAARDEALAAAGEDPVRVLRAAIQAFYDTWSANRELVTAAAQLRATSPEVERLWSRVITQLVEETAFAIEAERARGAAPPGPPARDLAVCLNWMNERVFATAFGAGAPSVAEDRLLETLQTVWLRAIYARD